VEPEQDARLLGQQVRTVAADLAEFGRRGGGLSFFGLTAGRSPSPAPSWAASAPGGHN